MTLHMNLKLDTVTQPHEFLAHRCFMGCDVCGKVTRHTIKMVNGVRVFACTTEGCTKTNKREGSIA